MGCKSSAAKYPTCGTILVPGPAGPGEGARHGVGNGSGIGSGGGLEREVQQHKASAAPMPPPVNVTLRVDPGLRDQSEGAGVHHLWILSLILPRGFE